MEKNARQLFLQNWMILLKDSIANKPLTKILIPGTHDSNTYDLQSYKFIKAFSTCQNLNVYEQLMHGIRFLDLRYAPGKNNTIINRHGILKGGDFLPNIIGIKRFLEEHPFEFIIVHIQEMRKMRIENSLNFVENIKKYLGEYLVNKHDVETWFELDKITIGEIWDTKKRIFMVNRDKLFPDNYKPPYDCEEIGILSEESHYHSLWHDVTDVELLIHKNTQHLKTRHLHNSKLFASQLMLTPQASVTHNIKALFNRKIHSINRLVESLFKGDRFINFIFDNLQNGFNILMFDLIEYKLKLVEAIIAANAETKLIIHQAMLDSKDITRKVADQVRMNRFLYIESLNHMIKGYKLQKSKLIIIYSFDTDPIQAITITEKDREILISYNPFDNTEDKISNKECINNYLFNLNDNGKKENSGENSSCNKLSASNIEKEEFYATKDES